MVVDAAVFGCDCNVLAWVLIRGEKEAGLPLLQRKEEGKKWGVGKKKTKTFTRNSFPFDANRKKKKKMQDVEYVEVPKDMCTYSIRQVCVHSLFDISSVGSLLFISLLCASRCQFYLHPSHQFFVKHSQTAPKASECEGKREGGKL